MSIENNNYSIQDIVFSFYKDKKNDCDRYYRLAEDPSLNNIYASLDSKESINSIYAQTAIVLITANKYEKNVLHKMVYENSNQNRITKFEVELPISSDRFNKLYAYCFKWGEYSVLHLHANVTGSYTLGGSADITRWVLSNEYLYPTIIISFGVCFGTKEKKNKLGDVIISDKIYPYFIGAKIKGEELYVVDDNMFYLNGNIRNKIKDLLDNNAFKNKTFLENYITGEAVVSSQKSRGQFVGITTQDISAGDMEGYGLFKECKSNCLITPCIIIKSICDWGVEKNFDANDTSLLERFIHIIGKYKNNYKLAKAVLETLKDRIQAYSAACSYNTLNTMIENKIFEQSLFIKLKLWIIELTSRKSIQCSSIKDKACNFVNETVVSVSDKFIHRCITLFVEEHLLSTSPNCLYEINTSDDCVNKNRDEVFELLNRRHFNA